MIEPRSGPGRPTNEGRCGKPARVNCDDFECWLRTTLETLSRKSDMAVPILYALEFRPAVLRYCDDGPATRRARAAAATGQEING